MFKLTGKSQMQGLGSTLLILHHYPKFADSATWEEKNPTDEDRLIRLGVILAGGGPATSEEKKDELLKNIIPSFKSLRICVTHPLNHDAEGYIVDGGIAIGDANALLMAKALAFSANLTTSTNKKSGFFQQVFDFLSNDMPVHLKALLTSLTAVQNFYGAKDDGISELLSVTKALGMILEQVKFNFRGTVRLEFHLPKGMQNPYIQLEKLELIIKGNVTGLKNALPLLHNASFPITVELDRFLSEILSLHLAKDYITTVLDKNKLWKLTIVDCHFGDNTSLLLDVLKQSDCLKTLNIEAYSYSTSCIMSTDQMTQIMDSLQLNTSLTHIKIIGQPVSILKAAKFFSSRKFNSTLQEFILDIRADESAADQDDNNYHLCERALLDSLKYNSTLTKVQLNKPFTGPKIQQWIAGNNVVEKENRSGKAAAKELWMCSSEVLPNELIQHIGFYTALQGLPDEERIAPQPG